MKITRIKKWPVMCLVLFGLAVSAQAQQTKKEPALNKQEITQALTKAVQQAQRVHRAEKATAGYCNPVSLSAPAAKPKTPFSTPSQLDSKTLKKMPYCVYCGQPILENNQACSQCDFKASCTTSCPDCGKNLRDSKNVNAKGIHRCLGKGQIQVAKKLVPGKKAK